MSLLNLIKVCILSVIRIQSLICQNVGIYTKNDESKMQSVI